MQKSCEVCVVTLQQMLDAVPDIAAILAPDGTILCVNDAWRQFSAANGGDQSSYYVGVNYLKTCQKCAEKGGEQAAHVMAGISRVLREGDEFQIEYPCHSRSEKRWFLLTAKPCEVGDERMVLVMHRNISIQKRQELLATDAEQHAKNLAAIVATMPDAVISFDLDGCITSWNRAAEELYGYLASEVIGRSMEILYPPGWPRKVKDYIRDIVELKLTRFDVIRQTKSGKHLTIEVTAAPIYSADGAVSGISNIHRNATEVRHAEQRLRDILDNLFAFVGILDLDGTLLEANRAPLEAAEIESSQVIGKKFWDCYWWNYSTDVQIQLQNACVRALAGEVVRYDVKVRVAGNKLIWIDFQLAPLRNADGNIVNLIPSGIDISERKAALDALRSSHDTFRNLVERSPFGVFTVDADFRLAHVSGGAQKAFANVRPLAGHDFADALRILWPEPFASEAIARFRHTLATGEPFRSPRTVERRHDIDEVESYDWMIERITMPDGRPGVVCNFYDLSERQRHEEQVRMLMGEVNHRAKNLLTVVMSMARQTAQGVSPQSFVSRFSQRLISLSASQDLIVEGNWRGVTVKKLVRSQLDHLGEDVWHNRIETDGLDILLTPAAAQGIGMALHELSTNAMKYGSLSVPEGMVKIDWGVSADATMFHMQWTERNGPVVSPPDRNGFGRTVIEKMAAISSGGDVDLDYASSGISWRLTAPTSRVAILSDAETN